MMDNLFSILRKASVKDKIEDTVFSGFLFIYHHGGYITVNESTEYRSLKIFIPHTRQVEDTQPADYSWLDDVFDNLETAWY